MGDLVFNGGKFGIWVGNQQVFSFILLDPNGIPDKNPSSRRAILPSTALRHASLRFGIVCPFLLDPFAAALKHLPGGWTFQGITLNNCKASSILSEAYD